MAQNFSEIANVLWSNVVLLRGDYKQVDDGKGIPQLSEDRSSLISAAVTGQLDISTLEEPA